MSEVKFSEVIEYVDEPTPRKPRPANLVVRVIGTGLNYYSRFIVDLERLGAVTIKDQTYDLKQESFFLVDHNCIYRFFRWLKRKVIPGIETFHAVYLEGTSDPMIVDKSPGDSATSRLLKIIKESTALKRGMSELFKTQLGGKTLIFFLVVAAIAVFGVMVLTGTIDLSGMV